MSCLAISRISTYELLFAALLILLFNPEDGGYLILQNVGWLSPHYIALYSRIQNSSVQLLIYNPSSLHHRLKYSKENMC
jgi:hypothetical protein